MAGLTKIKPSARWIGSRITREKSDRILAIARVPPELSARLLGIKITDEEPFSASELKVLRLLKERGLINPILLPEMPAARQWRHRTTRPDEFWQCDGTNLFAVGWGDYNLIPLEGD